MTINQLNQSNLCMKKRINPFLVKFSLFLIVSIFSYSISLSQAISNSENFSSKSGALMRTENIQIGVIRSISVFVVHYTDLIQNNKLNSVKIEYTYRGESGTKIEMLDNDEIDALMKSIKIIQDKILPTTASSETDVKYKARGGFGLGCLWIDSKWQPYLEIQHSIALITKEELATFYNFLEQAKLKL